MVTDSRLRSGSLTSTFTQGRDCYRWSSGDRCPTRPNEFSSRSVQTLRVQHLHPDGTGTRGRHRRHTVVLLGLGEGPCRGSGDGSFSEPPEDPSATLFRRTPRRRSGHTGPGRGPRGSRALRVSFLGEVRDESRGTQDGCQEVKESVLPRCWV